MEKNKQLQEVAYEAIQAYMTLIAQVDALGSPMLKAMVEPDNMYKEAMGMTERIEEIMERDA